MTKNRSKRLRKKLYVDEFQVMGFAVACDIDVNNFDEADAFLDRFLDEIEANGLIFGGGISMDSFSGFVVPEGRYDSATDEHRKLVDTWLSAQDNCSDIKVDSLVDAHH